MDRIEDLALWVHREVASYALPSFNAKSFYVENKAEQTYAVISVPERNPQKTTVMIMARVVGDHIIIDTDKTDRPLVEVLLRAGVAREQIILSYAGESLSAV